ncbi:MAG: hypothetical protein A3J28_11440 [Acidobacteria bacterium RIFCSPLOWO2_12_FULL_60_22]|nr:MAG: hypothetical protein A3J28_11440 [Acidobacteria bacterium RIFCSPLOWO2_12_FULL_60_22]
MPSKFQSGVRNLSEQAQALLHRMLDQGKTPAAIARAVRAQTKERVSAGAITRYASLYHQRRQKQQQIQQRMDGFLARVQKDGILVSDLLRAVLIERLSSADEDGTAAELDLLKLEEAERKRGEYELRQRQAHFSNLYRERELELKERKHTLAEKQFQLQREKVRANFQELERKAASGQPLTKEDIRRIREIYGLYDDAPQPTDDSEPGPNNGNDE